MEYLVKVGRELYIPDVECSAGNLHYSTVDIDPLYTLVNPRRPVLPYLRRLIGDLKDLHELYPTKRVNLLYEQEGDVLDIDLADLVTEPRFDFFVKATPNPKSMPKRFHFIYGDIFDRQQRLSRCQRVRDVFGPTNRLELTHVSSPMVKFVLKDDYQVVDMLASHEYKQKIKEKLKEYLDSVEQLADEDLLAARVLLALAFAEEPALTHEIVESLRNDGYGCPCYFDDHGGKDDLESKLSELDYRDFLTVSNGYVIKPQYRKRIIQEKLEEHLVGMKNVAETDLLGAGILLTLVEEQGSLQDVLWSLKNNGFDFEDSTDELRVVSSLERLVEEDFVREKDGQYEISPKYERPVKNSNQLSLPI